jgi:hypothetical protein
MVVGELACGMLRFVLSHPFARKKAKGWGTVDLWMDESGKCAFVLSQV